MKQMLSFAYQRALDIATEHAKTHVRAYHFGCAVLIDDMFHSVVTNDPDNHAEMNALSCIKCCLL